MSPGTQIILQIAGATVLLLWGLNMLRHSAAKLLSWRLKRLAARAGGGGLGAFGAGAVMGGLLQSSTAAISIGGSMASQRSISMGQGLALALGADAGATLAAQLLGFNLQGLLPLLLLAAYLIMRTGKSESARLVSHILFGMALLILSAGIILSATASLRDSPAAQNFFALLVSEPLVLMVLFAFLTLLCHSTLAPVLFVMALAGNEVADIGSCFWMILGINVGAGIPPITASLGEAVEARRIAAGNALFRLLGAVLFVPFVALLAGYVGNWDIAPSRLAAHFHTFVNVAMGAALLAFTPFAGRWLERLLSKTGGENEGQRLQYLRPPAVDISRSIADATRETLRMGDMVSRMLEIATRAIHDGDSGRRAEIGELDDDVDFLNREIKLFLTRIEEEKMNAEEKRRANLLLSTITHLEHIGDTIDYGVVSVMRRMRERRVRFSKDGINEIRDIHSLVRENMRGTLGLLISPDAAVAGHLRETCGKVARRCAQTFNSHLSRVRGGRPESIESSSMHLDWVRDLKRINGHIAEIADAIIAVNRPGKIVADNEV